MSERSSLALLGRPTNLASSRYLYMVVLLVQVSDIWKFAVKFPRGWNKCSKVVDSDLIGSRLPRQGSIGYSNNHEWWSMSFQPKYLFARQGLLVSLLSNDQ